MLENKTPRVRLSDLRAHEESQKERYASDPVYAHLWDEQVLENELTYEKLKSLYLHKAVVDKLMKDPERVLRIAWENIEKWKDSHRPDGMSVKYLDEWSKILDKDFQGIKKVLLGLDEYSCDLRQNSPFAGVLSDERRSEILQEFKKIQNRKLIDNESIK